MAEHEAATAGAKIKGQVLGDKIEYPVTWPGAEQAVYPNKGYGLCDDEMWSNRDGAVGWRSFQSLLELDVVPGVSIGWAAAAKLPFFGTKGQEQSSAGDAGYPTDYILTESETNAFKDGAMVMDEDMQFFIYAFGFATSRPFEMDATVGTAPVDTENLWLKGYARSIEEKVSDKFAFFINYPDTKCEYGGTKLKNWSCHSDTVGGDIPATSNRAGFVGINGVRRPVIAGYRTSKDLVTINIHSGFGASWLNDIAFAIPALEDDHTIVVPITCNAYGVEMKKKHCIVCIGGEYTTVEELANAVARIIGKSS